MLMCWYLHHKASACHNDALALEDDIVNIYLGLEWGNHDHVPKHHQDVSHGASVHSLFTSLPFRGIMLGNP